MKRPKLKHSLAKLQAEAAQVQARGKGQAEERRERRRPKVDRRVVWHQWSDGQRTLYPYRSALHDVPPTAVLVLGDGDLSFSTALMAIIDPTQIIATVLEDDDNELARKYPATIPLNVASLRDSSARLLLGVDATKLSLKYLSGKLDLKIDRIPLFTRLVFNFPHTGEGIKDRAHNIRAQQKLILAFLDAAAGLLEEQSKLHMVRPDDRLTRKTIMAAASSSSSSAMKGTQDGEDPSSETSEDEETRDPRVQQPEIHLTCWTGDPYDAWDVKKLAASGGRLRLLESFSFDAARYPGYQHCRTIGFVPADETFSRRPARTFVFVLNETRRGNPKGSANTR